MLTGKLWPAHPHPYRGECMSSWIVRCAHTNGMKVQTFCDRVFRKNYEIWNRDIDRNTPEWLIKKISNKTATTRKNTLKTTFKLYEKRLFPELHPASQLRWVMPLKHYHRITTGFALQYCPMCLAEDNEPYFRLAWRLAQHTFCPKHLIMMHDRCHQCKNPVAFHRIEQGHPQRFETNTLDRCWKCERPLSLAPINPVTIWHPSVFNQWHQILKLIERQFTNTGPVNYKRIALTHQICRILVSKNSAPKLQAYICNKTQQPIFPIDKGGTLFEQRNATERHYIHGLALWLTGRTPEKLRAALKSKTLKIHETYKDNEKYTKKWITEMLH